MRIAISILVCAGLALPLAAAPRGAVVVIPLDNFSGAQDAPARISSLLAKAIASRGWNVIENDDAESILENERVRYLDSLDESVRREILDTTGAAAIISGTIFTWSEGRNPVVALSARMVRADGTVAWSDIAALSSDDTERILGFGRKTAVTDVAEDAVAVLMRRFPRPGEESSPVRGASRPFLHGGPVSYFISDHPATSRLRVCVLPFDNLSTNPEASRIVTEILALRLAAANNFDVVEPAALRSAALATRAGSFRTINSDGLARLAGAVGTPLFIRGTIYDFADPAVRIGTDPRLDLEFSLIDVHGEQVLWSSQYARTGSDYTGFLLLGKISNIVSLADRVLSEMVDAGAHLAQKAPSHLAHRTKRAPEKQSERHDIQRSESQ